MIQEFKKFAMRGNVIDFLIISFSVFMMVKGINSFKGKHDKEAEKAASAPSREEILLSEIRDILKQQQNS